MVRQRISNKSYAMAVIVASEAKFYNSYKFFFIKSIHLNKLDESASVIVLTSL